MNGVLENNRLYKLDDKTRSQVINNYVQCIFVIDNRSFLFSWVWPFSRNFVQTLRCMEFVILLNRNVIGSKGMVKIEKNIEEFNVFAGTIVIIYDC